MFLRTRRQAASKPKAKGTSKALLFLIYFPNYAQPEMLKKSALKRGESKDADRLPVRACEHASALLTVGSRVCSKVSFL